MTDLKNDFKTNIFKKVYLLYGDERYLLNYYSNEFTKKLLPDGAALMNRDSFDGKDVSADEIITAAQTSPFLSAYRLIYVRDSQLFASGRKDDSEKMAEFLPRISEGAIIIFIEEDVEKRGRLYKKTVETGRVVFFETPGENELISWIGNVFKKKNKFINAQNASKFIRLVSGNMNNLYSEADKLAAFVSNRNEITAEDINAVCSVALEIKIFDLVAAVGGGNAEASVLMYRNMLNSHEKPMMIFAMIIRQFRMILQCKAMVEKKYPAYKIAEELNLRGFMVDEYIRQGKNFTAERLISALSDCERTDADIKSGKISDVAGVETLIIRYAQKA
ncbi:MAG: DNA polymerase III subunit delta [Defluviitaleaceae bacterium]|nr:DNA polymerase III subunit delta [Defluviitaleaceae bacterium]